MSIVCRGFGPTEPRSASKPQQRNWKPCYGNPGRNQMWMGEIRKSIDRGVPLVWSCMLGIVPETPALPQAFGGHMRLIIGYTADGRIVYTDSWGAGHERKFMKAEDAQLITTRLRTISRTVN